MDYNKLAEVLFPQIDKLPQDYENIYPARQLPKGAEVLRIAPSPTGFIHLGNLYGALADERVAHQSKGVFFLRIEDTDLKRKVDGAVETLLAAFKYFEIPFDEGAEVEDNNGNHYGPYYQRQRTEIYHTFAKDLIRKGHAYPCFCSEEEIKQQRELQQKDKLTTGYYGKWAKCRNLTLEEVEEHLKNKDPFVIRLRAQGDINIKHSFHDEIKGDITVIENDQDVVLLKADGIPTYHFAHAVDDHLMGTTIVLRGEEWLGTLPIHLELFKVLEFPLPKYAHTSQLMKIDNGVKRKLSKRKDPELSLDFYRKLGYHPDAVKIYLMTLLNWNFEEWYLKHPETPIQEFKFSLANMGQSGALFDLSKLNNISKTYLARKSLEEMKSWLLSYVKEFCPDKEEEYFGNEEYLNKILSLGMGLELKKRRKDYISCSQILESFSYYFDNCYQPQYQFKYDAELTASIVTMFKEVYDENDDNNTWFEKVKTIADKHGFASEMSAYKANPENYKGSVADVAEVIRIATTGLANTPDLYTIQHIMGLERTYSRLDQALAFLKENL